MSTRQKQQQLDSNSNPFDEPALQQDLQLLDDAELQEISDSSFEESEDNENEDRKVQIGAQQPKKRKKVKKNPEEKNESEEENVFDQQNIVDKLPHDKGKLQDMLLDVQSKIRQYRAQFFTQQSELLHIKSRVGDKSIPICADITKFDFDLLMSKQLQIANRQFQVLMMDPPWQLSTSQPSRGVAIQYCSLADELIGQIPVNKLQKEGFLFVWVINAKFQWTVNTMQKKWGYKVVDSINWVKKTVTGKIAKGHGFYLQHAKQTCLVGFKGDFTKFNGNVCSDIIFSDRRGQSQKPTQIYEYIEKLVPNGCYLEIFGRRNNLRDGWVTIGNQL